MKLVLFDIDGTMLRSGGAGRASLEAALLKVFGSHGGEGYHYDGKTDRQIVRELMRGEGHSDEWIDKRMDELLDLYIQGLHGELESRAHQVAIYPGVTELLDELEAREDVVIGLLTGNIERGAHTKLRAAGIDPSRFKVNAFGSDHEHRPELPPVAQRRAKEILGVNLPGESLFVIGDTPADIACGRSIGARAIAVATGRYSVPELSEHDPYAVFEDLSNTTAVINVIYSN
jgi:phosphoglycolate phosphatase